MRVYDQARRNRGVGGVRTPPHFHLGGSDPPKIWKILKRGFHIFQHQNTIKSSNVCYSGWINIYRLYDIPCTKNLVLYLLHDPTSRRFSPATLGGRGLQPPCFSWTVPLLVRGCVCRSFILFTAELPYNFCELELIVTSRRKGNWVIVAFVRLYFNFTNISKTIWYTI